jgi:hypothetical protein
MVTILAGSKSEAGMSSMSRVVFEGDDHLLWFFGYSMAFLVMGVL